MDYIFTEILRRCPAIPAGGVIHVGAFGGWEFCEYFSMGVKFLTAFEPQKKYFDIVMSHQVPDDVTFIAYNFALGDSNCIAEMNINNPPHLQCSTFRQPLDMTHYKVKEPIVMRRFDTLHDAFNIASKSKFLVIDVEGMELQVLHGMGRFFDDRYDGLCIECSRSPSVVDGPAASDIVAFVGELGYQPITDPAPDHGDVLFVHKRWL